MYIDLCIFILIAMMVIAIALRVYPVYVAKQQLDNFATELVREAEIAGRIGGETDRRAQTLRSTLGIDPTISWSTSGKVQLNEEFELECTLQTNIGLFDGFGSYPITLRARASGKSEVYWK